MARKRKGIRMNPPALPPLGEAGRTFRYALILTALIVALFAFLSKHMDGSSLKLIGELFIIISVGLSAFLFRKWNAFRMETDAFLVRDYGSESCHYRQKERQREKRRKGLDRAYELDEERISGKTKRNAPSEING